MDMKQCPVCEEGKLHYSICDYCHSEQSQIQLNNNPWKEAVIDKLIACCIYSDKHDHDARKAVNDLIAYELTLALDPQVSEDADNLLHQAPKGKQLVSRRDLDNIKVRAYELGQRELHDMILNILNETTP